MHLRFLSAALDDVTEAALHYANTEPQRAVRFFDAFDRAVELIEANPYVGKTIAKTARCFALHSFPYDVVYQIRIDEIVIAGVVHHRRDRSVWIERL
jgi:plasmid stabilization system protein ParE